MYELSRVRLHAVGPRAARYQDLTLDLRAVGAVVRNPVQDALFALPGLDAGGPGAGGPGAGGPGNGGPGNGGPGADDPDAGLVRRPSPATVLFLENGGGKSVLMRLIFSVMLPGRRQVVGTQHTRILEQYVLAGDISHIALEWQHTRTGERVVTGKICAWRDHVISADPNRFLEAWYSFRPSARLSLDTLPLTENGRLVSFAGFRDRISEAHRTEPAIQAVWETGREAWTSNVIDLGLDPELFAYQRRMNAGEGEAAEAFNFRSDEAFVDWLLTATTSEEDHRGLGDVVAAYATRLAERQGLLDERDFVAGAIERLGPLAAAAAEATENRALHHSAQTDANRLATAFAARLAAETLRHATLAGEADQARRAEREAEATATRLGRVARELRRLVAGLRWRQAEATEQAIRGDRDTARRRLQAWHAVELLVRAAETGAAADTVRDAVAEQEQQAAPVLAQRNLAARQLARCLLATAEAADEQAGRCDAAAKATEALITGHDRDRTTEVTAAATCRGNAGRAEEAVVQVRQAVREAAREGLIDPAAATTDSEAGAAVAAASQAAADAATQATGRLAEAYREQASLTTERRRLTPPIRAARDALPSLATAAATTAEAVGAAGRAAAAVTGDQRLRDLLGSEQIAPDEDVPTLLDLLDQAIAGSVGEQTTLRVADATDERILTALGTGGLLPPAEEIIQALGTLESAKITAWSGWRYLERKTPAVRAEILAAYPYLVDGIVINNPGQLGEARQALAAARLLPCRVVAVGTTATLEQREGVGAPPGLDSLIEPNPALYDAERAETERSEITQRRSERQAALARLADQQRVDEQSRERCRRWVREYPPGALARLREAADQAQAAADGARERIAELEQAADQIAERESELATALPDLRAAETATAAVAARLAGLAEQVARLPELKTLERTAREQADRHGQAAEEHQRAIDQLRRAASEHQRTADGHRRTARGCRDELGKVAGGGDVDPSEPVPELSLPALRAAYQAAVLAYQRVEVGESLRAELDRAELAEAAARAEVEGLDAALREQAQALTGSVEGTDPGARAAAVDRLGREIATLEERLAEQIRLAGELGNAYRAIPPQEIGLEPYGRPRDIPGGERLAAQASADHETARSIQEQATERRGRLDQQAAATAEALRAFRAHLDALGQIAVPDEVTGEEAARLAFDGSDGEARERRIAVSTLLAEADQLRRDAEHAVRKAADTLAVYATAERFDLVTIPVRRQITTVERERLPGYAAEWERALRVRLGTLDADLEQINRNRGAIIDRYQGLVQQALRTLRGAQRLSKLPAGLGDWSGQEFLRIRFADPEPQALADRLGTVLDEAAAGFVPADPAGGAAGGAAAAPAAGGGGAGTAGGGGGPATGGKRASRRGAKCDGLTLILRGVHAAMRPGGVRVEMLKPDSVLRTERVRVASVGDIFSGGQLLTAAIILYCTMAALRANERGLARRPHAGVLFLDNPIGRASAGYLLELQLGVAETLGVQLIYTTGLFDLSALSVFPLIIRLRNDADLRAGLKYLSVEASIAEALGRLPEPDGTSTVAGTRLFKRPGDRP